MTPLTSAAMGKYAAAGVDYEVLDAGKRAAVAAALATTAFASQRGAQGIDASRGEPAFVFELGGQHLAVVLECLGTKSTIARQYQDLTGINRFADIAYDSVAAIVNDMICVGALPLVVSAYFATGSPAWYQAEGRFEQLVKGWGDACRDAGATWGGGESPGLSGIVVDTEIDLAGAAVGAIPAGHEPILGNRLAVDDEIVLLAGTGLHANGASLARSVAGGLASGYRTQLGDGVALGDALLVPAPIYTGVMEAWLAAGVPISYVSHITGHGFRKIMRADRDFVYRITEVPPVPEVLSFLVAEAGLDAHEAYGTFNMGAGLAACCASGSSGDVVRLAKEQGHEAWACGVVEQGRRSVVIEPLSITYSAEDLQLR